MAALIISISLDISVENNSESDTEMPERHASPTPHDDMLTRWRSRVPSRSSSPTTSTLKIPIAPILPAPSVIVAPSTDIISPVDATPRIHRRRAILIQPGQDIPIGRLYRTYLGGPCRTLTVRKSVRPLCSHCLALSEAYRRWRSALLSTMYPPTTSESSDGDSSSESSAGPSRKRCRSPTANVISSILASRDLVPSCADLLPHCKRFRDFISPKDSVKEDIDTNVFESIEADATTAEVKVDRDIVVEVDECIDMEVDVEDEVEDEVESSDKGTMKVGVDVVAEIDIPDGMLKLDAMECLEQVEEVMQDIYRHVMEIPLQRIEDIEMGQRELEARSLIAGGERELVYLSKMRFRRLETFAARRLALAAYEVTHAANALEAESQIQNGSEGDNGNGRNGIDGKGNGENGNGGNGDPKENDRGARPVAELMKLITEVYCLRNEIQKMESELWNLTVKNNDSAAYTQRFQVLTMMCTKMVPEEKDRVEKFIGGLLNDIQGNGYAVKNAENNRRLEVNQRDNRRQQPPFKRQNVTRAYTASNNERRGYVGPLLYCSKCKLHHEGPCTVKCGKCNKVGHMTKDCKNVVAVPTTQRALTRGNKAGKKTDEAIGKAYVLGGGDTNPDFQRCHGYKRFSNLGKTPKPLRGYF
nr:hypothetical protein [Tanacetum cinerariifolium]